MTIGLIGRENELYILKIRFDRLHTRTHTLQTPHTLQTTSKLSYLHMYIRGASKNLCFYL